MAQAQESASGPCLQHFMTPNAPKRLAHTHFGAKTRTQTNHLDIKPHTQNTNTGLPYIHRPHGFTPIIKCRLIILPAITPNSLPSHGEKRRPCLPVPAFSDTTTDPPWLSRDKIYSLDPCSIQYMAQAQESASGPCLQHFMTPKAPKRLAHTHFGAKTPTQTNHLDIKPHSKHKYRPSLHPQTTWFHSNHKMHVGDTSTCHNTQLTPQPREKRRPCLPVPAFSDTTTDPRWLSRPKIYSLDPCSMQNMAQAQESASGPCLQQFMTRKAPKCLAHTHFGAKTRTQTNHLDIKPHSKHQYRPSLHPQTTWFHSNHKMQVDHTTCHNTQLTPQPRGKKAPLPTCASLFRHHDRSTIAQPTQDIFP